MSRRFRSYYHQLEDKRSPNTLQRIGNTASTIVKTAAVAATVVGATRMAARSGILERAGDYILAASDTTNQIMHRRNASWSLQDVRSTFHSSLSSIQTTNATSVNLRMTEFEKVLRQRQRVYDGAVKRAISDGVSPEIGAPRITKEDAIETAKRMTEEMDTAIVKKFERQPGFMNYLLDQDSMTVGRAKREGLISQDGQALIDVLEGNLNRSVDHFQVDPRLFVKGSGQTSNYTSWSHITDRTLNWWSNTMIGGLGGFSDKLAGRHSPFFHVFGGEKDGYHPVMRFIEDLVRVDKGEQGVDFLERKLRDQYLVAGDRVMNIYDKDLSFDGMKLVSGRSGPHARMLRNMGHLDRIGRGDKPRTLLGQTLGIVGLDSPLDVGYQDMPSRFNRISSWALKGLNEDHIPNIIRQIETDNPLTYGQFADLNRFMHEHIGGFDGEVMNILKSLPSMDSHFQKYDFTSTEDVLRAVIDISGPEGLPGTTNLGRMARQIQEDPYGFLNTHHIESTDTVFGSSVQKRTGEYIARKELTNVALRNIIDDTQSLQLVLNNAYVTNSITSQQYQRAMNTLALQDFTDHTKTIYDGMRDAQRMVSGGDSWKWRKQELDSGLQKTIRSVFFGEELRPFQEEMQTITSRFAGILSSGPTIGRSPEQFAGLGTNYTVIRKSNILSSLMNLDIGSLWSSGRELLSGHSSLTQVTSATLVPYQAMARLSDTLANFGFGLSSASMDSVPNLFTGIFGKRMLAGYGALALGKYASYELENLTGYGIGQRYWRAAAQARMDLAGNSDRRDRTEQRKRNRELMPGIERLQHLPLVGWMMQPVRSADELHDYFLEGDRPVRAGRWWRMGSTTPYTGSGTDYFLPNEYIMGTTSWQFTDTLYGDKDEYWSRSWMPTPRHPFSPLKALADPYWIENKHKDDRPYPLTGELFEPSMPFAPLLNMTVGNIVKPVRSMHRKELAQYNKDLKEHGNQRTRSLPQGAVLGLVSDGTIVPKNFRPAFPDYHSSQYVGQQYDAIRADDYGGVPQGFYVHGHMPAMDPHKMINESAMYGNNTGIEHPQGTMYFQGSYSPVAGAYQSHQVLGDDHSIGENILFVPGQHVSNDTIMDRFKPTSIKDDIIHSFFGKEPEQKSRQVVHALNEGIIQQRGMFGSMIEDVERPPSINTSEIFHPNSLGYRLSSMRWTGVKLMGARGFLFDTVTGGDPYKHKSMIGSAQNIYSQERLLWDMNLGGFTGDFSEIYRRFLPKRSSTIQEWNPIRNTMPTWLPGPENRIDFLHGDPFCVSPDTLIETGGGAYVRADEVIKGMIIRTHKGSMIPVKNIARRKIAENEKVFKITVSSLPAHPFTVSEEHPILTINNPKQRKNYNENVRVKKYINANLVLNEYINGFEGTQKELANILQIPFSSVSSAVRLLKQNKKIKSCSGSSAVQIIDNKQFDIDFLQRGLQWTESQELKIGDYVAYPLPENKPEDLTIDIATYLDNKQYVFTDEFCYYDRMTQKHAEIYEYFDANPNKTFIRGDLKQLLEENGWDRNMFENIQGSIRAGYFPKRIPRFIKIDEQFSLLSGYYLAEGYSGQGFAFHADEHQYHQEVQNALFNIFGIKSAIHYCKGNGASITFHSYPLKELLPILFGDYANNKKIPEFFFRTSNEVISELLRGLINGDGCCFQTGNRPRISLKTTSELLAYQTRLLALRFGVCGNIIKHDAHTSVIKTGPKKDTSINLKDSYSVCFNSNAAINLAGILGYEKITAKENKKSTWFVDDKYLYLRVNKKEEVSDVPEVLGFEVNTDDSFCVLGVATHNTKLPNGEVRLPGAAYESVRTLHSDPWFGEYGAFERFRILADVAPHSDQYKVYKETVRDMLGQGMLPSEWTSKYETILDQVTERNIKYEVTPYVFKAALDTERHSVTITDYIDANTFMTEEFPDNPIQLAGLRMKDGSDISDFLHIGDTIQILTASDRTGKVNQNSLQTISATLFSGEENLNQKFLGMGVAAQNDDDNSPAAIWTKYSPSEIRLGAGFESASHFNTPILHNRFLGIHSPLEYYKRKLVYGKERQSWNPLEIGRQIVEPTIESFSSLHPIESLARGVFTGALVGKLFFGGGTRTRGAAIIVGGASLVASTAVSVSEFLTNKKWIPGRRRHEHNIQEYFDILEYVKYKGLYHQASEKARKEEGINIHFILDQLAKEDKESRSAKAELEEQKRLLIIDGAHHNKGQILRIEEQIRELDQDKTTLPLEPYTLQAIKYRAKYEATLHGIDPETQDYRMIYRALPSRDREFYEHFIKETDPKKRKEILDLIPHNQRPLYQAAWDMPVDDRPDLNTYFKKHNLPGPDWLGWDPAVDLNLFKVKYAASESVDMEAIGVWEGDLHDAQNIGIPDFNPFQRSGMQARIRRNLSQVLRGTGMKDVVIDIVESSSPGVDIQFNLIQERQYEMQRALTRLVGGM